MLNQIDDIYNINEKGFEKFQQPTPNALGNSAETGSMSPCFVLLLALPLVASQYMGFWELPLSRCEGQLQHGPGREEAAKMELYVKIESESLNASMHTGEIWLLETDYTNMAVLYACKDILDMVYIEMAWVMSRERTLPSRMVGEALELLEGQGIDVSQMTRADQTDCDPPAAESWEELEETTPS
ncbi:unnamed protein product [Arctogadus glacialis]